MSNERHETVADNMSVNHQFREVAKMIPHEEVAVSKMETTTPTRENSSQVGNAAAMREIAELRKGISELLDALQAIYDEECTSYGTGEVYDKWRKVLKGASND